MSQKFFRQSGEPGVMESRGRGIFLDEGPTVPAAGSVGWAPGSLFMLTVSPAANAGWYINNGTFASCSFQPFIPSNGVAPVTAGATLAATAILHAGRTILMPAVCAITLPAATATGNKYRFVVNVVSTTVTITTNTTDVYKGTVWNSKPGSTWATANIGESFVSTANTVVGFTGASNPQGGASIGDFVEIQDIAAGVWQIYGLVTNATTPTTPFSV